MNNNSSSLLFFSKPVDRADFLSLIKTSLSIAEFRFTRQASLAWLANFPGDLLVSLLLAESMVGEGKFAQAIPALEKLITLDPEFEEVYEILDFARLSNQSKDPTGNHKGVAANALKNHSAPSAALEWRTHDNASQKALNLNQFEEAEKHLQKALLANPDSPIPAIHQVKIAQKQKEYQTVHNLAELYHQRWPDCLQFSLYLAEAYLQVGDDTQAVSLLHHCVSRDSAGQVPHRLWGLDHPYETLWPEKMEIRFDLPIPANVSAMMGWNQLNAGNVKPGEQNTSGAFLMPESTIQSLESLSGSTAQDLASGSTQASPAAEASTSTRVGKRRSKFQKDDPLENLEDLQGIQSEFEKIAKKVNQTNVSQSDGRFPIYVILSTRKGLEDQYGCQTAAIINDQMKNLVFEIRKRPGWGSLLFLPDDPICTSALNLKPVLPGDPWKIKLSISDLDRSLSKRGERIGALLIVGGPDVVPFHHLPNPTDDSDPDVPSDNPYATSDENYFIPEWPLGRLPGESGSDAGLLIEKLRKLILVYAKETHSGKNLFAQMSRTFRSAVENVIDHFRQRKLRISFGYSAQVWREASAEVFKTIGQPKGLLTSPPVTSGCALNSALLPTHLGYFNLHGIQDGVEWYGQKCQDEDPDSPDYPVAMSPKDIQNGDRVPEFIFSEACYGAFLKDQKTDESMALKFLSGGTSAFVGSTCVSYGSVTKPLIAADLLAQGFFDQLKEGQAVGNALRRSKINLAREMSSRQGYLDGEDQKTLLSFILYGDPLAVLKKNSPSSKVILRSRFHPVLKTVTDRRDEAMSADQLPPIMMAQVKEIVNQYLPGLRDAEFSLNLQSCTCKNENTQCTGCKISAKGPAFRNQKRVVVTLTKEFRGHKGTHHMYARMTLDPNGKVLKISSSR
jgi:tetratricopeptide (TPR) repeat protein